MLHLCSVVSPASGCGQGTLATSIQFAHANPFEGPSPHTTIIHTKQKQTQKKPKKKETVPIPPPPPPNVLFSVSDTVCVLRFNQVWHRE